jgi:hypothetical protein
MGGAGANNSRAATRYVLEVAGIHPPADTAPPAGFPAPAPPADTHPDLRA